MVNQEIPRIANGTLQIEKSNWRGTLAKCRVLVCEHLDSTWSAYYGPHLVSRYAPDGAPADQTLKFLDTARLRAYHRPESRGARVLRGRGP